MAALDETQLGKLPRRQRSVASGHRVRNRQPLGGLSGEGSSMTFCSTFCAAVTVASGSGIDASSSCVYGCSARFWHVFCGNDFADAAQVH